MKVLVTGSTGFIGSHLCRELVDLGHRVSAFHRPNSPLTLIDNLPLEHAIGDITQPDTLANALVGVDVVFHAAARLGISTPNLTYSVTVRGTRNLLKACLDAGVSRVVHTSSVAALGVPNVNGLGTENGAMSLMNEAHSWNYRPERWRYAHAKHLAEMEVQNAVASGLDVVIVNPSLVIGSGDINRISGDVILHLARGNLKISSQGGLNAIHIADVVRGHIAAFEEGRTGERYIVGSDNMTHQRFLELTAEVVGVDPPRIMLPGRLLRAFSGPITGLQKVIPLPFSGEAMHKIGYYFYCDVSKAENELGLINRRSIRQAISESYNWYQEQGAY